MSRRVATLLTLVLITLAAPDMSESQRRSLGIIHQEAPSWGVTEWYNLPPGKETLDVEDFAGKVVYLFGFQSWCPGCHSHGFPSLKKVSEHYRGNDAVVFVAVQTVFEGFQTNTAKNGREDMTEFGLDIPMGHDAGPNDSHSILMKRYRSGGTPWTIIIDRDGVVRYNDFSIEPQYAIALIGRLLKVRTGEPARDKKDS